MLIQSIRKHLEWETAISMTNINVIVGFSIDCCSSTIWCTWNQKLHRVQNDIAHIVTRPPTYDSQDLCWTRSIRLFQPYTTGFGDSPHFQILCIVQGWPLLLARPQYPLFQTFGMVYHAVLAPSGFWVGMPTITILFLDLAILWIYPHFWVVYWDMSIWS